jgi:hypothetical protein
MSLISYRKMEFSALKKNNIKFATISYIVGDCVEVPESAGLWNRVRIATEKMAEKYRKSDRGERA